MDSNPLADRDGSLPSDKEVKVVVWDSSIVATCRVNNAIVPVVGAPTLEVKLNQIGVPRPDGASCSPLSRSLAGDRS